MNESSLQADTKSIVQAHTVCTTQIKRKCEINVTIMHLLLLKLFVWKYSILQRKVSFSEQQRIVLGFDLSDPL